MASGKTRRLQRIFRENQRTVIVAMDHAHYFGNLPGFENPGQIITQVVAGGADAILATVGLAKNFTAELARVGLILRVDGGVSRLGTRAWRGNLIFGAETALRMGADGVIAMGFPGSENENVNLSYLADLSDQCEQWGLPMVAEMLPRGFEGGDDARTAKSIAMTMRIGAELGADIIKTQFTDDVASFKEALANCYVPVVMLGGAKAEDDAALLQTVREGMDAGARGVAMGRNIWGHANPQKMTAAVVAIVHEDATVAQAMALLA